MIYHCRAAEQHNLFDCLLFLNLGARQLSRRCPLCSWKLSAVLAQVSHPGRQLCCMERQSECTQATGDSKRPVRAGMDRLGFVPLRCYGHAPPDSSIFVNALKHDCSKSGGSDAFADMARWLSATTSLTASFKPRRVRRFFSLGRRVVFYFFAFCLKSGLRLWS